LIDPYIPDEESEEPFTTSTRLNGVRINTRVIPAGGAARGGDWCEAFAISSDVVALSIGDVCGHGVEKFETMVVIRQAIRDAALRGVDPAQVLVHAGRTLHDYDGDETATAIVGLLDTRRRSLTYANAGHPPPLMLGPYGTMFLEHSSTDVPLGVDRASVTAVHMVNAAAATLFVFYTDGVSESQRDSIEGSARLRVAATFAYDMPELPTATAIEALMLTESNFDDAAILTAWTPLVPMVRRRKLGRAISTNSRLQWQ
jgi:serine phosphatase RsbU (regulator of sigma subunit)